MCPKYSDIDIKWISYLKENEASFFEKYVYKLSVDIKLLKSGFYFFDNPWDMERSATPYSLIGGRFNVSPNGDPEWVFQFSRLEWLTKIILFYKITADESCIYWWVDFVKDFMSHNNVSSNSLFVTKSKLIRKIHSLLNRTYHKGKYYPFYPTYRTLDTSIRNYILLNHITTIKKLQSIPYTRNIIERIRKDNEYVYSGLREFDKTSNWGIIIVTNYICCHLLLGTDKNGISGALSKLCEMLSLQLYKGGAHIESSNMYHNQVLLSLLRVMYWLKKNKMNCPDEVIDATKRMALYTKTMTDPVNMQVMYGDSDNTNLSTLNYIADIILYDCVESFPSEPDLLLLQEFDLPVLIPNKKTVENKDNVVCFDDGVAKLTSGEMTIMIYNSLYHSSHKHTDNGSFVLYYMNKPFIVDSGRYSYHDAYWREYFKSELCHNVVTISDFDLIIGKSDINNREICDVKIEKEILDDSISVILTYKLSNKECIIERKFWIYPNNILVIRDKVFCSSVYTMYQYLSFHSDVNIEPYGNEYKLFNGENSLYLTTTYEQSLLVEGFISPYYNEKIKSMKIKFSSSLNSEMTKYTIFSSAPINPVEKNRFLR